MQYVKLTMALFAALTVTAAYAEPAPAPEVAVAPTAQTKAPIAVPPYRTFLTVQRYTLESNGDPSTSISNVRLEMKFANDVTIKLPGGEQHWPIGNGQVQEVNQTFEIPWAFVKGDAFGFSLQMVRKGAQILPCVFEVRELSQFNRTYTCQTDVNWQVTNKVPENRVLREGVLIRVFTDRNTPAKEMPKDAVALK